MRTIQLIACAAAAAVLAACGSVEYRDTNATVDARPECGAGESRPGEGVPAWCERKHEAVWSSDPESTELRLGGDDH
ncbi:hypothetical protein N799_12860 [Lysobacter arseniciresistens ZS79]|uniref:Lipoprotein n=1 Tax=Lysobacter arseniciresistens ZS79 TaxID=913325 RepID=A0A0A0EQ43_9GAMM|nr:hypothetical protein [Lysobacter arseniciresistens]KGM53111.1 hypothetical protein N799_12860 [Lysobacter arseniciresistens ZS79]